MGERQKYLEEIINSYISEMNKNKYKKLSIRDIINSKYENDILAVYKELGGVTDNFAFRIDGYDVQADKFVIELDEELHFNRYRKITLQSELYNEPKKFPLENYKKYCEVYEPQ